MNGMVGTLRFVEKVWRIAEKVRGASEASASSENSLEKILHKTIKKVSDDIETFKFNTAVSALMICANEMDSSAEISKDLFKKFIQMLAPFAPHIAEEVWAGIGERGSVHVSAWPTYDPNLVADDTVVIGVQINGKVRAAITLAVDESEDSARAKVLALPDVQKWLDGKEIKKFIYVPGKIASIVA